MTQEKTQTVATRKREQYLPATITKDQAAFLLHSIWPKAPEAEVKKASILCQQYGLNPLMRQVYLIEFGKDWAIVLGIKATRQIAQQALKKRGITYSYTDGPRVMTDKEQIKIRGQVDAEKIWAVTILSDQNGNLFPGYGSWLRAKTPYGTDKGNDAFNMAFIRSERQALDKLAPGELPDIEVGDDTYIEGDYKVIIEKGRQEFIEQVQKDIDDLWGTKPPNQPAPAPTSTPATLEKSGIADTDGGNGVASPATATETGGSFADWVVDNLPLAKWREAAVVSWIRSKANFSGLDISGKFVDILNRLTPEQAEFLRKEILSRIELA